MGADDFMRMQPLRRTYLFILIISISRYNTVTYYILRLHLLLYPLYFDVEGIVFCFFKEISLQQSLLCM